MILKVYLNDANSFKMNLSENKSLFEYVDRDGQSKYIVTPDIDLKKYRCSKYARLSAEKMFGYKYTPANAWDLKYVNGVIIPEKHLRNGKRGDIITFFNLLSKYNTIDDKNFDIKGNVRNCTHAGLLYDFNENDEPVIIHQYISLLEVRLLHEMEDEYKFRPIEIIRINH